MKDGSLLPVEQRSVEWFANFEIIEAHVDEAIASFVPGFEQRMATIDRVGGQQGHGASDLASLILELARNQIDINRGEGSAALVPGEVESRIEDFFSMLFTTGDFRMLETMVAQSQLEHSVESALFRTNPEIAFTAFMLGVESTYHWMKGIIDYAHEGHIIAQTDTLVETDAVDPALFDDIMIDYQRTLAIYRRLSGGRHLRPANMEELVGTTTQVLSAFIAA